MKVALHSNDLSADGISFTRKTNPGFVEGTLWVICTSAAASASDRFDTVTVKQTVNLMIQLRAHRRNTATVLAQIF